MADLLIGHDVGTGGSKAVLADTDGNIVASTFEPYEIHYPKPGRAEQDPVDWWRAVTVSTRRLLAESGADPSDVRGVGFAGQMIGVVPVDASGELELTRFHRHPEFGHNVFERKGSTCQEESDSHPSFARRR